MSGLNGAEAAECIPQDMPEAREMKNTSQKALLCECISIVRLDVGAKTAQSGNQRRERETRSALDPADCRNITLGDISRLIRLYRMDKRERKKCCDEIWHAGLKIRRGLKKKNLNQKNRGPRKADETNSFLCGQTSSCRLIFHDRLTEIICLHVQHYWQSNYSQIR